MVAEEAIDGIKTFARYNGNDAEFPNCYEVDGSQVLAATADAVASGELCYLLNEGAGKTIYYQTLGSDDHPVLSADHKVVYKDAEGNYTNTQPDGIVTPQTSNLKSQTSNQYDLQGRQVKNAAKGQIIIVRMSDGSVRKLMNK